MPHHSTPHPPESLLVALADGESSGFGRAGLLLHLAVCRRCRGRFIAIRAGKRAIREALAPLTIPARSADAWARLILLHTAPNPGRIPAAMLGLAAGVLLLVALARALAPREGPTAEFLAAIERLPTRPDLGDAPPAREARQDSRFIAQLLALTHTGAAEVMRDDCCDDHDGEGPADDGIFAARLPEARLALHVMYDDADGTRTLSPGDLVRSVSRSTVDAQASTGGVPPLLATSSLAHVTLLHASVLNP